jgi:hypothetical protein
MLPTILNTIKIHRPGSCVPTAIAYLPQLKDGRDYVIEGWVQFGERGQQHEHTWMVVDGQIFDPTIIQFRRLRHYDKGPRRQFSKVMPVEEYRFWWRLSRSPWWIARLRSFGVQL